MLDLKELLIAHNVCCYIQLWDCDGQCELIVLWAEHIKN